ncbi:Vegetative incompatibility protein HET-E-1 [Escovopsis weberi]|uniref:Vegetative incompatibility protein HET-E-1 n=1 Tax=Escovopsis weberi TaxID=150374 RepID=A0A0M8MXE0_ESCWE|nr:Vegetative incompatibility protein HET-E-1 [Escovopsis weberi]
MRLINTKNYEIETFLGTHIPKYAILSHTWGNDEVTMEQMVAGTADTKSDGYLKIKNVCKQAVTDGCEYAWIDTCCIDRKDSAELDRAINSMFDWYHRAEICYAHLADVRSIKNPDEKGSEFRRSRWFRRGWTLQELLAPTKLDFYSHHWEYIGPVTALYDTIEGITGIESYYLQRASSPYSFMFRNASVAARMSWAAMRDTSLPEDKAYSMLGIFDIKMPLMYGEGTKAFLRLQEEIIKQCDDQTILAWGWKRPLSPPSSPGSRSPLAHGFLAGSPASFAGCQDLTRWPGPEVGGRVFPINKRGLHITVPLRHDGGNRYTAMLRCCSKTSPDKAICLPLVKDRDNETDPKGISCYLRAEESLADNCAKLNPKWPPTTICISHRPWYPKLVVETKTWSQGFYLRSLPTDCVIEQVYPSKEWSAVDNVMTISPGVDANEPRIFCGRCGSGDFVVAVRWLRHSREWRCGIARRWNAGEKMTKAEMELLMFSNKVMLEHSRVEVSMRKMMVSGNRELMTIDVIEKGFDEIEEKKDEREQDVSAVFSIIWGLGAACAMVPYVMWLKKTLRK